MQVLPSPHTSGQDWRGIAQVLAISDELGAYMEVDDLLRHAVELARVRLHLERVSLYLYDAVYGLMRGSFGTGPAGETVDERWHSHPVAREHCEALKQLVPRGTLWNYYDDVELQVIQPRRKLVVGKGWNTTTPLLAAGKVVGVMYTDAALSGSNFDSERQAHAALLCGSVANLVYTRQPWLMKKLSAGPGQPTRVVRRALAALERDGDVRGQELARDFGISPGHLARLFKAEMGVSLVEYRNRLRLRSFFAHVEQGEKNFIRAAHSAGFGSYAQFHRVYRRMLGGTPSDLIARTLPAK